MTAHRAPEPSHLQQKIDAFALRMAAVLEGTATHQHGVTSGHEWSWSTPAGAWAVQVGGMLDPAPIVTGPDGNRWHTSAVALSQVDLVLLMLELAGAIPGRPAARGQVYGAAATPGLASPRHGGTGGSTIVRRLGPGGVVPAETPDPAQPRA